MQTLAKFMKHIEPRQRIRMPICSTDPPAVFEEIAKLVAAYGELIGRDIEKIAAQCGRNKAHLEAAAAAYLGAIGENIPDREIRAAVKRCARAKFKMRGCKMESAV